MNESVLNKPLVLSLNASWERLGWKTPKQAVTAMCGGAYGGTPPALAMSITMDENGNLTEAIPMKWEEWIKLPVRPEDLALQTKSGPIRCPMVVIAPNYKRMPVKAQRLTKAAILARDQGVCQYTGEKLPKSQLNIDHVIPKDRGGKDEWGNLVTSRKDLNSKKGNRTNEEMGYKLIKKPVAPKPVPVSFHITEARRPEHKPFILK